MVSVYRSPSMISNDCFIEITDMFTQLLSISIGLLILCNKNALEL